MGIFSWIVLGLLAGALAKMIMPGKQGGGIIRTTLLGVAGALLGGFIGEQLGYGGVQSFSWSSLGWAVIGAFLLLMVFGAFRQRKA